MFKPKHLPIASTDTLNIWQKNNYLYIRPSNFSISPTHYFSSN